MSLDLEKYICAVPFTSLEIHTNHYFLCCPSWLTKKFSREEYPINEIWNSDGVIEVRKSLMDGSFKYCDNKLCPFLSRLIKFGKENGPIKHKDKLHGKMKNHLLDGTGIMPSDSPSVVNFNFDRSCNYKCPSCRIDTIVANTSERKTHQKTIEEIDKYYSHDVEYLYITGSGDPFASATFREYLRSFDSTKYKNLKGIHLHTNASLWNEEMWDSMPNIHKYVKSCEISIDAGTKYTYENITRINGDWDNLLNNLSFISTIPSLQTIKTSFVVQDSNYMEMETFHKIMYGIFGDKVNVFFGKITNWGTFSEGEYQLKKVWDETHPEHNKFLIEFNKVWKYPRVFHNMYEFIDYKKTLI